ncbi:IS66 family insertion sequence element accessory protein TnpB [Methylobacterium radiotolerans]
MIEIDFGGGAVSRSVGTSTWRRCVGCVRLWRRDDPRSHRRRVWLATRHTDMRKGFPGLALQGQEVLWRDPLNEHLFCFHGRRGDLLKVIRHDGQGAWVSSRPPIEPGRRPGMRRGRGAPASSHSASECWVVAASDLLPTRVRRWG